MPGAGTHTTIIQRLAKAAKDNGDLAVGKFLTDPSLNGNWATYDSQAALQSRYAVLGAMGPDIFYMMLDYGSSVQQFEDVVLKIAGTFRCAGELSSQLNTLINSTLDGLTLGVWSDIQDVFSNLGNIMTEGIVDLLLGDFNFWYFFLPLRQVDDYPENWYWADWLHYVKTGCFTQKLLDNAAAQQAADPDPDSATSKCLGAYALGYLTHYIADTVGHAYVNRIVESPWRNMWQRHHLVENFIDAHVWAEWHDAGTKPARPADEDNLDTILSEGGAIPREGAASLNYARLNDLCNIGSAGVDPIIDNAISLISAQIQAGLFNIGLSSVQTLQAPDDPVFTTWTEFIADTMKQVYPPTGSAFPTPDQSHPTRMGRYPTPDDIAGAYSAYRLVLSLATDDHVDKPFFPNVLGDIGAILAQMGKDIAKELSSVPPPPAPAGGQGISLEGLWDSLKSELKWLGQVAIAAVKVVGDMIAAAIEIGRQIEADLIKAGLFLINTILYSIYHTLRMTVVMSAYSTPFTEDLTSTWGPLDLRTLWNAPGQERTPLYPVEPVVSQRDFTTDSSHPFSPYRPYLQPSGLAPVNVESPAIAFPNQVLDWTTPDDMLDSRFPRTHDMFNANGPAPPIKASLLNPDGTTLTSLETFNSNERYFGSIMANCERALQFAVPYLSGTAYPGGVVLPDYNLDSDRGYAWPCWDVDWTYPHPPFGFPWNGCDPYPSDTLARVWSDAIPPPINWGAAPPCKNWVPLGLRKGLNTKDPWGRPRSGDAVVNATALGSPGDCQYGSVPFPAIVVNPNREHLANLDPCVHPARPAQQLPPPGGGLLGPDYLFAPQDFLYSNAADQEDPHDDVVNIYLSFPYAGQTTAENDGRLTDFLRTVAVAAIADPGLVLANAVSLWLGGASTPKPGGHRHRVTAPGQEGGNQPLATAVAQLAVTGRQAFETFEQWTPTDAKLVAQYAKWFPDSTYTEDEIAGAAGSVLDAGYRALWGVRSNDPAWRYQRVNTRQWIAVSGFDDTPHRPVNVPTSPYPQYDVTFNVPVPPDPERDSLQVTTRYMIASAGAWVGPWQGETTSFSNPDPELLGSPPAALPAGPAPRTIPKDAPLIPDGNKIIIYIHGGGSRAEEAVDMASWFIVEGNAAGEQYTVISFDLPNSAYGSRFDVTKVTGGGPYTYGPGDVLAFEVQYIMAFIEKLEETIGNVTGRIAGVMGGSLGGNTSLLLTNFYNKPNLSGTSNRDYLRTIVSWSVTAMAQSKYLDILAQGDVANFLDGIQGAVREDEPFGNHQIQAQYIQDMYTKPLSPNPLLYIPPQPVEWYRGGYAPDGALNWQPCKDEAIAKSRFDRYEVYSKFERAWITAVDLEQIQISFLDGRPGTPAPQPGSNLMLVAGDNDNYFPNRIYNSTIAVIRAMRSQDSPPSGKAEFWLDTGHSIHNERPRLFAREILYFLANPDAGDSPNGTVVTTPPNAVNSMVDQ